MAFMLNSWADAEATIVDKMQTIVAKGQQLFAKFFSALKNAPIFINLTPNIWLWTMINQNLEKTQAREWVEQAWKKHGDIIFRLCEIKCNNIDDAKDLFQTVALKFCRNAKALMSRDEVMSWLVKVLHNTFLDSVPARSRFSPMSYVAERSPDYIPFRLDDSVFFESQGQEEALRLLERAAEILNPVERMIIDMTFLGGISTEMQCNILGLSKNAVRKRRYFALKKMRNMVDAELDGSLNGATVA